MSKKSSKSAQRYAEEFDHGFDRAAFEGEGSLEAQEAIKTHRERLQMLRRVGGNPIPCGHLNDLGAIQAVISEIRLVASEFPEGDPLRVAVDSHLENFASAHPHLFDATPWEDLQGALEASEWIALGWQLSFIHCLAHFGCETRTGRTMNPAKAAGRPRKKRRPNALKTAVFDAWEDYLKDTGGKGSKSDFAENWFFKEADIYDVVADVTDDEFRRKGFVAKSNTIRRWLK
jgi:hypothetical protein